MIYFEELQYFYDNYIYKHPFFGNGFGIQYAFDIAEVKSTTAKMNDLLSPEFGPLTLLTEVGLFGSAFYYLILAFFYRKSILVLKNPGNLCDWSKVVY